MKVRDFDNYDQTLLWAALKAGYLYAEIVKGPLGPKVASVSKQNPLALIDRDETRLARVIRLDEVAGLADSATSPSVIH